MKSNDFKPTAIQAAKQASKVIIHYYGKKENIKIKPNKTFVAEADVKANEAIIKIIKKNFPKHSILSEETGFEDNKSDYKWVIDPIDGTHNFIHGIPIFGISIALEYKNEIVLGIMSFPILKLTAFAEKGKGAFLNGKRIKVSDKKDINHAFILYEFGYSDRDEKIDFLEKFVHKAVDIRNFGCAVYALLLIACGKSDGYVILSTQEWDIAAGFLIVEEAGGKITDLQGKKYDIQQHQFVVSNGKIHKELLRYVK